MNRIFCVKCKVTVVVSNIFYFHPYSMEDSHFDEHIFQMGWELNHQLGKSYKLKCNFSDFLKGTFDLEMTINCIGGEVVISIDDYIPNKRVAIGWGVGALAMQILLIIQEEMFEI